MKLFSKIFLLFFIALYCNLNLANSFVLTSNRLNDGEALDSDFVLNRFGCKGLNFSPPLLWEDVPLGTKSLALTMRDTDVANGEFYHWILVNIPAGTNRLWQNTEKSISYPLPQGSILLKNGYGVAGYSGPCPQKGSEPHRYEITVHALSVESVAKDKNSSFKEVIDAIKSSEIEKATLTTIYQNK